VRATVPVEPWMHGLDARIVIPTSKPVVRVVFDPDKKIPDANRGDGLFTLGVPPAP
jgi:hypothetical protein